MDTKLMGKVNNIQSLPEKTVEYHKYCRIRYSSRYRDFLAARETEREWHERRKCHKMAFEELCIFIEENILQYHRCYLLKFLAHVYNAAMARANEENGYDWQPTNVRNDYVKEKILMSHAHKIKAQYVNNRLVVAPAHVRVDETTVESLKEVDEMQGAALALREAVFNIRKKPLPDKPTVQDLIKGECDIPENLIQFLKTLIGGPSTPAKDNRNISYRRALSIAQDVIHATRNGRVKTSKHITLGITMKSITSSRKVVDVLNRYGHCCSYTVTEELETEATFAATADTNVCPFGIKLSPCLKTGVAFDNFDRFVETRSGKDTLHDTVGIIFQNQENTDAALDVQPGSSDVGGDDDATFQTTSASGTRKRRSFQAVFPELEPYMKKPKMSDVLLPCDHEWRHFIPKNIQCVKQLDFLWVMSHAFNVPHTPMWVGFNSKILMDTSCMQNVRYLTTINLSPTQTAVVIETLKQAQKVAEECGQLYIEITYDLAIAKVALQLQKTEQPLYDNCFIHLGSFHIMMAFFKAIDECGLTHVMVESELLANGSVDSFLKGKHFNRCKRLHPLVALGLEILLFKEFLLVKGINIDETVTNEIEELLNTQLSTDTTPFNINGALLHIMELYASYKLETLQGLNGKTAQFFIMYVQYIEYYLTLQRSIRTSDFDLFKYILPKIANIFFVMNQPNYARWLVKYHDNLLRIPDTHPGLEVNLEQGSFGVKRTGKSFSKQAIDLTLEQTINADAARRLTGVIHFTNSISARQRWARSHTIRSMIISHVFEQAGLQKSQDITADMEPRNITTSIASLQKFMESVDKAMNPFDSGLDKDVLFNIATGKGAPENVTNFLLTCEEVGTRQREKFIAECAADPSRFEKSIARNRVFNFSATATIKKAKVANKVQELHMQRDLFGRMLALSLEENIDVTKILAYPLTPVPLSLCHIDGSMCKTDKSSLMKTLEKQMDPNNNPPQGIDILIIDGFFILHLMTNVAQTFGAISRQIMSMITRTPAWRIDIVFDRYNSPSIKDNEHVRRETTGQRPYCITGPDQVRPTDFSEELRNTNFKEALVRFLIDHWQSDELTPFLTTKTVHLNFDNCYRFEVINGHVIRTVIPSLSCMAHEEADTKIVYHVCNIIDVGELVIRTPDTDVLVIMLGNMSSLNSPSLNIYMEVGTGNHQRYIDITKLHQQLGQAMCKALPAFHALTGCDYNPAFFRKGKNRPFSLLQNSVSYQKAFGKLTENSVLEAEREQIFIVLEKFVCAMYQMPQCTSVNEARYAIFSNTYQAKTHNEPFSKKFKNVDSASLPPCKFELEQQLLRTQYIGTLWNNAHLQTPTTLQAQNFGWEIQDGKLCIVWFQGDQTPPLVKDVIVQPHAEDTETSDDTDSSGSEDESYLSDQ